MKSIIVLLLIFITISPNVYSQESEFIKVTKLVPLYCLHEILERQSNVSTVVIESGKAIDKNCIDRVRITFQNGDFQKVRNIKFDLIILDKKDDKELILYSGRHYVEITISPEEVKSLDLFLSNKISPPEGKIDFDDQTSWNWKVEIIRINSK